MSSVAVIIPTLNPGSSAERLAQGLVRQSKQPTKVVIIDSASEDRSLRVWEAYGFETISVRRSEFDHGGTRNRAAKHADTDIFVFLTQDAVPADERWLEALTAPIGKEGVVATFGRQVPKEDAGPLETFTRNFNYPAQSHTKSALDIEKLGIRAFFFSNVCSAIGAEAFWSVGGFPEGIIQNEDLILAAKFLRAGYKIRYTAEASVLHSHNYSLKQQFKRNFDIGASLYQAGDLLAGAKTTGEGLRFLRAQLEHAFGSGRWALAPRVVIEAVTKYLAFSLGKRERHLPRSLKRHLSMHRYYWQDKT